MVLNLVIYMQVERVNQCIKQHHITVQYFLCIDEKYEIINLISERYESFYLMGNQSILNKVQEYV